MRARFTVICVLVLALVTVVFYLGQLAATPQLLAKSVELSRAGNSAGSAALAGAPAPPKSYYLPIEEQQLAEMYTRVRADEAAFAAGKYWLLAAWAILIALVPLSGSLYVAREIAAARESLTEKIEGRLTAAEASAAATVTAAQAQAALISQQVDALIAEVRERHLRVETEVKFQIHAGKAGMRYGMAYLFYTVRDLNRAIDHSKDALDAVTKSLGSLGELESMKTGLTAEQAITRDELAVFKCYVQADLAYYLAERSGGIVAGPDACEALEHLRRLEAGWDILGAVKPIQLVDSYLFVLTSVANATHQEKQRGRAVLIDRCAELRATFGADVSGWSEKVRRYKRTFGADAI